MGMRCRSHTTFQLCFFFNDTATTEIYTLSLHDALPISEALRIAARLDDRGPQYYVLDAMGCLAASSGQARLAAQLLGAAEGVRAGIGGRVVAMLAPLRGRAKESAIAALGASRFEYEFKAGKG